MKKNLLLNTDSYKTSHFNQYPPGATKITSYIEARPGEGLQNVVFFGLQAALIEYFENPLTKWDVDEAEAIIKASGLPFNREGFDHVIDKFGGYIPVEIDAIPEGSVVPRGTPLATISNIGGAKTIWATSYFETLLLRGVWYPTTVASLSYSIRRIVAEYWMRSVDQDRLEGLNFALHDFGARGATSGESAAIGGLAHLLNFSGTDTLEANLAAQQYYDADGQVVGCSIPAAEHSTVTSWGPDREVEAYKTILNAYPTGLVSVVSDSYDLFNAINNIWGDTLRNDVATREGRVVIRPDSGDPLTITLKTVEALGEKFGFTVNSKGFKVLPDHIRLIQGDGVTAVTIGAILNNFLVHGWSAENIAFGMGGGLLQQVNRDTLRFAMKACEINIDGQRLPVSKKPATDPTKGSKAWRQYVYSHAGQVFSSPVEDDDQGARLDRTVYDGADRDGLHPKVREDFFTIKKRVNDHFWK